MNLLNPFQLRTLLICWGIVWITLFTGCAMSGRGVPAPVEDRNKSKPQATPKSSVESPRSAPKKSCCGFVFRRAYQARFLHSQARRYLDPYRTGSRTKLARHHPLECDREPQFDRSGASVARVAAFCRICPGGWLSSLLHPLALSRLTKICQLTIQVPSRLTPPPQKLSRNPWCLDGQQLALFSQTLTRLKTRV